MDSIAKRAEMTGLREMNINGRATHAGGPLLGLKIVEPTANLL